MKFLSSLILLAAISLSAQNLMPQQYKPHPAASGVDEIKITAGKKEIVSFERVPVIPGEKYHFSARLKLDNAKQSHVKVAWLDVSGRTCKWDYICAGQDGTRDWFKIAKTLTAPDTAHYLVVQILAGGIPEQPGTTCFSNGEILQTKSDRMRTATHLKDLDTDFKGIKDVIRPKRSKTSWYSAGAVSENMLPQIIREKQSGETDAIVEIKPDSSIIRDLTLLPAGIYELALEAKGKGEISVSARGTERTMALGGRWADYSLAFEQKVSGKCWIEIMLTEDSKTLFVKNIVLKKADDELLKAWEKQEETFAALGFIPSHLSAQRPAPPVEGQAVRNAADIPEKMSRKAIFSDKRYDTRVKNVDGIVSFFTVRDFRQMNADELPDWMKNLIEKEEAYGTVCIFPGGVLPASILKHGQNKDSMKFVNLRKSLLRKYMNAGGRVVWMGDVTLYCVQDSSGPLMPGGSSYQKPLANIETSQAIFYGAKGTAEITEEGKKWGLRNAYPPVRPVNLDSVTISFAGVHSENASQIFLKTLNPRYPLSGLLSFPMSIDGTNKELLKNIYRLALYLGTEVEVPEIPIAAEKEKEIKLFNATKHSAYLRGENIPAEIQIINNSAQNISCKLEYALLFNGKAIYSGHKNLEVPAKDRNGISEIFETEKLASGDYSLLASVMKDGRKILSESFPVYVRTISDNPFFYGIWTAVPENTYRAESMFDEFKERCLEPIVGGKNEAILKHGMRFAGKIEGDGGFPREVPEKQHPEYLLRDNKGNPLTGIWRPANKKVGLIHPEVRVRRAENTVRQIKNYEAPNLYPWFLTNDDFSQFYIMDWSDYTKKSFRQSSGLEAPAGYTCKDSIVPENDPWFRWYLFSLYDVTGGHDQAVREAKDAACPAGRLGPVPGGMQMPLWTRAQYPPAQFGNGHFDLISYYYYLIYWQPSIGILFWNEVARMNNPDLPLWCTTDCYITNESSYHRNNFFLHLAGGVNGLNYFHYRNAKNVSPLGWDELKKTGQIVKRFGKLIYNLKAAPKKTALFLPLAAAAYDDGSYPFRALYAYANLLAAHVDVKPICREEILAGELCKYDTVLLYNAAKISAAVWDILKDYIRDGGEVFIDKLSAVNIPGAKRLDIDIAMGNLPGGPGIKDYLIPERVQLIRKALPKLAGIPYDSDSGELVMRAFEADGVGYLWLVNIHDHDEYTFLNLKQGAGRVHDDPEKVETEVLGFLKARGVYDKTFTSEITLPGGEYHVCDILKGKELKTSSSDDGRKKCSVSMERLGGTLLAFYPELPGKIEITASSAEQGKNASMKIMVKDFKNKMMKGIVPVETKIFYPDGTESPYGKYDIARNGVLSLGFIPAINESAGKWKIKVTELATGISAESIFTVKGN